MATAIDELVVQKWIDKELSTDRFLEYKGEVENQKKRKDAPEAESTEASEGGKFCHCVSC
jgi:hypothetical protein